MVREPDATMQPAPQDNQLMSKHRVLSLKPHPRLEWRGQDGQSVTEQPDHSASLGDSITSSTRIRFSLHTGGHISSLTIVLFAAMPPGSKPGRPQLFSLDSIAGMECSCSRRLRAPAAALAAKTSSTERDDGLISAARPFTKRFGDAPASSTTCRSYCAGRPDAVSG
jgi:hypothetical protein